VVGSRETLWSIAQDELGAATRWREIADLNYGLRQADGGSLDHRHWVAPGWTLLIPTGGAKGDERVHPGARPPRSVPTAPIAPTAPLAPFGAGVVGNGVAAFLDRMRRVQQRYRREGELIALPDGPNTIEQRLRMGDGRRILEDCDAAVRDVITRLVARDGPVPAPSPIAGVRVSTDVVEVLLGSPSDATGGHEAAGLPGVRETVVLDRSRLRRAGQQGGPVTGPPLIPLLVSVGRTTDTTAFVNLEWLGSLAVDGDGSAEEFFRAVCLELATSAGPRSFDLRLVGLDRELGRFDRVQTVDPGDRFALDELAGAVRDRVAQVRTDPAVTGSRRLAEASLRASASALRRPLVVACGPAVPRDLAAEIGDAAGDDSGAVVALALGCMPGSRHTLWIAGDGEDASTEILGSWLTPQRVDRAELQQVDDLLERAAERRSVSAKAAAAASHDARQFDQTSDGIRTEIEVCVLGPIEIHGALRPFTRAWAEELVVYLSMHPNGVANEVWATALWPDRLMAPSSLHSTASVARRALGRSRNGDDHLPRSHGRLRLGPTVGTDWRRFVAICEAGTPTAWRTALELVRGQPFTGLRASDWPVLEGIAPAIEATVVDVSGRLSGACLQIGDAAGAEWAARRGLMVSPYDERLYRMLLRSADAAGNPAGVESAMEELIQLVADDIEPLDSVHPSTLDLYRSLTRRRTAVQAPVRTPRAARARLTPEARVQIDRRRLTTRTRVEDRNDD
jgi:DNA-binding SARP family transcriptional activator